MPHDPRVCLQDMRGAARLIEQFTAGRTVSSYSADPMCRAALEREFEIIGEALNRLLQADPGLAAQIPGYRQIIAFRNQLSHGYHAVADAIVWGIVENDLADLIRQVETLLAALDNP
jgi:uncharacterized protein with HEPN domain